MTQPTKRFDLWRRLYTRFLIEPTPAEGEGPAVSTVISPVTDADVLLREYLHPGATGDLQASAGTFSALISVPDGKVWILKAAWREATIANTRIVLSAGYGIMNLTILDTAEQAVSVNNIRIGEGVFIGLLTTGNAGDNLVDLRLAVEEEDVF